MTVLTYHLPFLFSLTIPSSKLSTFLSLSHVDLLIVTRPSYFGASANAIKPYDTPVLPSRIFITTSLCDCRLTLSLKEEPCGKRFVDFTSFPSSASCFGKSVSEGSYSPFLNRFSTGGLIGAYIFGINEFITKSSMSSFK